MKKLVRELRRYTAVVLAVLILFNGIRFENLILRAETTVSGNDSSGQQSESVSENENTGQQSESVSENDDTEQQSESVSENENTGQQSESVSENNSTEQQRGLMNEISDEIPPALLAPVDLIAPQVLTNSTTGQRLSDGGVYYIEADTSITGEAGQSGLIVPSDSMVVLYIPQGLTLTVKGGDGSGINGGGAGIELPSTSTLIIMGDGTLEATGGNGGIPGEGDDSGQAFFMLNFASDADKTKTNVTTAEFYTGSGGDGGYGGGGAGAGIGGKGGTGGTGGSGGTGAKVTVAGEQKQTISSWTVNYSAGTGQKGGSGTSGGDMGTLYVCGVTVNAAPGENPEAGASAGSYLAAGDSCTVITEADYDYDTDSYSPDYPYLVRFQGGGTDDWDWTTVCVGQGGPGGGGGVPALAADAIGSGAPGGGGGAGGGGGGVDASDDAGAGSENHNYWQDIGPRGRMNAGVPGSGGSLNGSIASSDDITLRGTDVILHGGYTASGNGGDSGDSGNKGSAGTVYHTTGANVGGRTTINATPGRATLPSYSVTFQDEDGTQIRSQTYTFGALQGNTITIPAAPEGYKNWRVTTAALAIDSTQNNTPLTTDGAVYNPGEILTIESSVHGDVVLEPYEKVVYTLRLHPNGGTVTIGEYTIAGNNFASMSVPYGLSVIKDHTYTVTGGSAGSSIQWNFKGWCYSSAGDSVDVATDADLSKLTQIDGATVTLYAVWEVANQTGGTYYTSLQNGSFETPVISKWYYQFTPYTNFAGLEWRTTASDKRIEFGRPSINVAASQKAYSVSAASDGEQFAELNAECVAALYQTVAATPGVVMNWSLDHHARLSTSEQMEVWIGPREYIEEALAAYSSMNTSSGANGQSNNSGSTTVDEVFAKYPSLYRYNTVTGSADGTNPSNYSSASLTKWQTHSGSYTVPTDMDSGWDGLITFAFVSTSSSSKTCGNMLDDISFTTADIRLKAKVTISSSGGGTTSILTPDSTFTIDGGTNNEQVVVEYDRGDTDTEIVQIRPDPDEGYTFIGLLEDGTFTPAAEADLNRTPGEINGDNIVVLYAKNSTVTLALNGGELPGGSDQICYELDAITNTTYTTVEPTRSGYHFKGWTAIDSKSGGRSGEGGLKVGGTVTYTANNIDNVSVRKLTAANPDSIILEAATVTDAENFGMVLVAEWELIPAVATSVEIWTNANNEYRQSTESEELGVPIYDEGGNIIGYEPAYELISVSKHNATLNTNGETFAFTDGAGNGTVQLTTPTAEGYVFSGWLYDDKYFVPKDAVITYNIVDDGNGGTKAQISFPIGTRVYTGALDENGKRVYETAHEKVIMDVPQQMTFFAQWKSGIPVPDPGAKRYTGELLVSDVIGTEQYDVTTNDGGENAGAYEVVYTLKDSVDKEEFAWESVTTAVSGVTGSADGQTVTISADGKTATVQFRILQAVNAWTIPLICPGFAYDGVTKANATADSKFGDESMGITYYTDQDCTTKTTSADGAESEGSAPMNAGNYWVKAVVPETANYTGLEKTVPFAITISARTQLPDANPVHETVQNKNDGKIIGVDDAMEYLTADKDPATATDSDWISVPSTETEISDLPDGTYYVRYKETENYNVGEAVAVTINPGPPLVLTFLAPGAQNLSERTRKREVGWQENTNAPAGPDITGYDFQNWKAEDSTTINAGAAINGIEESITYTAVYKPKTIKVILNNAGGSGGSNIIWEKYATGFYLDNGGVIDEIKPMGAAANAVLVPDKRGYTFKGYYTQEEGRGTQYIGADGYYTGEAPTLLNPGEGDVTLYAYWVQNKYHVWVTVGENNVDSTNVTVTGLGNPDSDSRSDEIIYTDDKTVIITAKIGFEITYIDVYVNGVLKNTIGSKAEEAAALSGGQTIIINMDEDYPEGTQALPGDIDITVNVELRPLTITYLTTGGSAGVLDYMIPSDAPVSFKAGDTVELPIAEKTGYTFDGWESTTVGIDLNADSEGVVRIIPNDVTVGVSVKPKFTPEVYTITYEENGGSTVHDSTYTYGIGAGLTAEVPIRKGYDFKGWYANEALTIPATDITATDIGDKIFYAKWEISTYNVILDPDGGKIGDRAVDETVIIEYPYGEATPLPSDVTKDGYKFEGWDDKATPITEHLTQIPVNAEGDKEYIAVWKKYVDAPIPVSVMYDGNSHSSSLADTTDYTVTNVTKTDVGSYAVELTLKKSDETLWRPRTDVVISEDGTIATVLFKITPAINYFTVELTCESFRYNTEPASAYADAKFGDVKYTYYKGEDCTIPTTLVNSGADNEGGAPRNVGTYWVKAIVEETANYNGLEAKKEFTISKGEHSQLPNARPVHESIKNKDDGKIIGIDDTMEYLTSDKDPATATDSDWISVPSGKTELSDLPDGTYYVRYKENQNQNTGEAVEVTVNPGAPLVLTFLASGADTESERTQTIDDIGWNDDVNALMGPAKSGYDFRHWKEESSETTVSEGELISNVTANTTYIAVYEPKKIKVLLDDGEGLGGSGSIWEKYATGFYLDNSGVIDETKQMGARANAVALPAKAGYTFNGYYTLPTGGEQIIDERGYLNDSVLPTRFMTTATLYARYTENEYTIRVIVEGGNEEKLNYSGLPADGKISYTEQVAAEFSTKPGYNLRYIIIYVNGLERFRAGEPDNADSELGEPYAVTVQMSEDNPGGSKNNPGNVIIAVNTQIIFHNIHYLPSDGNSDSEPDYTVIGDKPEWFSEMEETTLPEAEKPGYEFTGWIIRVDEDGDGSYESIIDGRESDPVNKIPEGVDMDVAVQPVFVPISYIINYVTDGGTWKDGYTATTGYTINDTVILPEDNNIIKEGYGFAGWYANADFEGGAITTFGPGEIGDKTFYAKWIPNKYCVTVNNGTADLSPALYAKGELVTITANEAPDGQSFSKWTVITENATLADTSKATTTFTMPAADVEVTASYRTVDQEDSGNPSKPGKPGKPGNPGEAEDFEQSKNSNSSAANGSDKNGNMNAFNSPDGEEDTSNSGSYKKPIPQTNDDYLLPILLILLGVCVLGSGTCVFLFLRSGKEGKKQNGKLRKMTLPIGVFCIVAGISSTVLLAEQIGQYRQGTKIYEELSEYISIQTKNSVEDIQEKPDAEDSSIITVDFEELKQTGSDVVAWLMQEDTKINYPIVQYEDNDYYLNRLYDGTKNKVGSLFADYENTADFRDYNTIIYGHNMRDGSMFASLTNYAKQSYYDEHKTMWLVTPDKTFVVEVFAAFVAEPDESGTASSPWTLTWENPDEYAKWLNAMQERSVIESETSVTFGERVLTLSTCTSGGKKRFIVMGKLA